MANQPTSMSGKDWTILLVLSVIWGGAFFFIEVAVETMAPFSFVLARVVLAAAVLSGVLLARGERLPLPQGAALAFLILALLNNVIPFLLFAWAQKTITGGLGSILNAMTPIWGVIVAHIATSDEKATPAKVAGVILGFGGVAVLIGPGNGIGRTTRAAVEAAVKAKRALVLDAGAISSFTGESGKLAKLLKMNRSPALITPHDGEFARLFASDSAQVLGIESKIEKARAAARLLHATVLLKGPDTVVASPDGRASVADNAPPWLATAGAGDVLGGIALGLVAQGMPMFEAASAAVWLHGEAAVEAGYGMTAEDLSPALREVLKRLYGSFAPEISASASATTSSWSKASRSAL